MEKEWLDELLLKTDLIKIISRYVPLVKKGDTWWGCCPFHHEKTPSFSVSQGKQFYHCFGCKASGNAITFLKNIESISGGEAIKILADEVGFKIPESTSKKHFNEEEYAKKKDRLTALMKDAALQYHENLYSAAAKPALDYLNRRGIDMTLIRKFGLGYSIDWTQMIDHLLSLGYTKSEMKDAGLAEQRADSYYDVFNRRLIIPIINNMNKVIAFGGRTLEANPDFAKYRNSSQTILFDKSKTIYGINLLKKKKMKEVINYIIITEGYMDVISLHKAGFDTAVASMGTALTLSQAKLLSNYCNKIYISYDGDGAGQKATLRGLDILMSAGLNVKVVNLPEGLDPDDVIKSKGKEFYEGLLDAAVPLCAFKIDTLRKSFDLSKADEKAKFAVEAVKVIKALENPVERDDYFKKVSELTGYTMQVLYKQAEIDMQIEPEKEKDAQEIKSSQSRYEQAKRFVLVSLLQKLPFVNFEEDYYSLFDDEFSLKVHNYCRECYRQGKNFAGMFEIFGENELPKLQELLDYEFLAGDDENKFNNCLNILKVEMLTRNKKELVDSYEKSKIDNSTPTEILRKTQAKILKEIQKVDLSINQIKNGTE